jgi:histidyl-tRNA synthetase
MDLLVKKHRFKEKKRMEKQLGNVTKDIKQQLSRTNKVMEMLKQVNCRLKCIDLNMFRGMRDLNK